MSTDSNSPDHNKQASRVCSGCKKEYPLTFEFWYHQASNKDGFKTQCRQCVNAHGARWAAQNREKHLENRRKWSKANPEKVRAYTNMITRNTKIGGRNEPNCGSPITQNAQEQSSAGILKKSEKHSVNTGNCSCGQCGSAIIAEKNIQQQISFGIGALRSFQVSAKPVMTKAVMEYCFAGD